jgi:PAS domain S-box-containing protein
VKVELSSNSQPRSRSAAITTDVSPADGRYQGLYTKAPVACVALDSSGVIREANLAAENLLHAELGTLVGQTLFRFVAEPHEAALYAHLRRVCETSERDAINLSLRISGSVHPIVVEIISAMANASTLEVVSVLVDITARRRAEMVLDFLDNAGQALATVATTGAVVEQIPELAVPLLGDLCVVEFRDFANVIHHAALHVDPARGSELRRLGSAFFELPEIKPSVASALSGAGPQLIEDLQPTEATGDSGLEPLGRGAVGRIGSLLIVPLEGRGAVFGCIAVGTVGDRILAREDMPLALELARRAALAIDNGRLFSELYDANAAKDRFLAMLSHELRTPLTPVLSAVTAIVAKGHAGDHDVMAIFKMIQRNVQIEARLIDDLLDLTRVSRGQFELTFDDVDVHDLVRSVAAICQSDAARKRIELVIETNARRSRVRGDPARLEQILWNLLKNAIKFTPARGRVVVRTHNSADEVHVAVEDNGIGIEPERMARIFLPFVQADPSISRTFGGMGLGLSISKSLAEAHEGSIIVASEGAGQGATFTLALRSLRSWESVPPAGSETALPAELASVPLPRPPKLPGTAGLRLRVLLVEDDPDTLEVTSMLLRDWHYEVATAESVSQALLHLGDQQFDLLISDIALPDGSGLDLMRAVHERHRGTKGIALSGFGTQEDVRRAKLAGFMVHLTKPVSFPRLETTIREITG